MPNCAPAWRLLSAIVFLTSIGQVALGSSVHPERPTVRQEPQTPSSERLVEDVNITGNRRLRTEDLLYYVQTHKGDVYNEQQVQRDLQALLALNFFDKTQTRVLRETGPRGGVVVTFDVKELPIIRDLTFKGLSSISDADVLKAFREQRIGISKEAVLDPVKLNNSKRVVKELLAAQGRPNATIDIVQDQVSATSVAITYNVNEGQRVRVVEIRFSGNQHFHQGELRSQMKYVKEAGLITRFKGDDILDREKLDADLNNVKNYMRSKGYLQGRTGDPVVEGLGKRTTGFPVHLPLISSTDEALRITIPVVEGRLYRIGQLKIEGNSIFSEQIIRSVIGLKPGDVANGERIYKGLFEDLKKLYGTQGFIQYEPEPDATYHDNPTNPSEGIADFTINITEGKQFTLRRLEFSGNTYTRDQVLRREVLLNEGDIYNQAYLEFSVLRLNQLGFFDRIDKEKDVDFRQNDEEGLVDVTIKVAERGKQQISFNGGVSGIGGSFFGLNYSTNNLLGRGESLSFNFSLGNRQKSVVFSFTEPYIHNRPISGGFSIFTQSLKFFGEGTLLSQNVSAQENLVNSELGTLTSPINEEDLFTQTSTGVTLFASSSLSEFYKKRPFTRASRVGLSYTLSETSVKNPTVNSQGNPLTFIPVVYNQPNILSSIISPSFVYDTRNASIDPTRGRQIALSASVAGLGGDVRTYQPTASYIQFIPVRRKRSKEPEVFGFRLQAGYIGNFGVTSKISQSEQSSLAFVNGVPIFNRFFLGDEFTIRGYNVRSISPIAPLQLGVTSNDVMVASNATGPPTPVTGLSSSLSDALTRLGTFTGLGGSNPSIKIPLTPTFVGGDTQLLGNFEYRIPIFGPVSIAAFLDVGSSFNLRKGADQVFSSNFLSDQPFLNNIGLISLRNGTQFAPVSLNTLAVASNPQLAFLSTTGLVVRDNRLVSQEEFNNALRVGPLDPNSGLPFGFRQIFLRGNAQTNTDVQLSQSAFASLSDYRTSYGGELRVQLPVVNVPFRLIYAFNPNARNGISPQLPNFFFSERKTAFRFSIGRTF